MRYSYEWTGTTQLCIPTKTWMDDWRQLFVNNGTARYCNWLLTWIKTDNFEWKEKHQKLNYWFKHSEYAWKRAKTQHELWSNISRKKHKYNMLWFTQHLPLEDYLRDCSKRGSSAVWSGLQFRNLFRHFLDWTIFSSNSTRSWKKCERSYEQWKLEVGFCVNHHHTGFVHLAYIDVLSLAISERLSWKRYWNWGFRTNT